VHLIELGEVVLLVRSERRRSARLDFQEGPAVLEEYNKIWDTLTVARIILEDQTAWVLNLKLLDQETLVLAFQQWLILPLLL
jgi:hypothetical protein